MDSSNAATTDSGDACGRASIALVLPAWNEAEAITRAVAEADVALRAIADRYEIIVVDDGSRDATAAIVESLAKDNPALRLVRHETNRGYGAALRSGFAAATCDLVAFTDADSQFNLNELDRFVLLARDYQVVCGYRIDRQDSPLRCLYSRVYNQLVRLLLGTQVRDVDCALKMFHRDALANLKITTDGFLVNSDLLTQARQQKLSVVEVGVTHRARTEGTSTVSIHHIPVVLTSLLRYWWNQVQFPASDRENRAARPLASLGAQNVKRLRWAQWLLLGAAALLLATNLGYPLLDRDETRYAEIPREMVASGNWVLPQLNYEPYYDKPALLYWMCAASYSALGVNETAARLVPALSALATLAITMWFGRRMFGRPAALLGGGVLLLSVGFICAGRILIIDGVLTLFTTASLFAAYEAVRSPRFRWGWWTVAAIAAGIGFLAKGPIALVLLGPPVATFAWLTAGASQPRVRHWAYLMAVVGTIAAPWFVIVNQHDPNFIYEFFYLHNVARFAGAFHARPFWYFVPVILIAGHPWSFLTAPLASYLFGRSEEVRRRRPPALGYLLAWSGWCFVFFSASKCKLPTYIMPALPALALMMGHYLEQAVFSSLKAPWLDFARRWSPRLATGATCLGGVGFGVFALIADFEQPAIVWLLIAGWIGLLVALMMFRKIWEQPRLGWGVCAVATILLGTIVFHREIPQFAASRTLYGPDSPLLATAPTVETPIVTVAHEWAGIPFNLHRNDVKNVLQPSAPELQRLVQQHDRVLVVLKSRNCGVDELRAALPPDIRLTTTAERGSAILVVAEREAAANVASKPIVASNPGDDIASPR
ncbi:MAG: glycosyltransferase [Planctomycetales bacterium]|nr:glycosyltransferase [Planctomycetales bacterium]